jgi:hypothetical protein
MRRPSRRTVLAAASLAAAVVAGTSFAFLTKDRSTTALVARDEPSASPTPTPTGPPSETPSPTPEPSETPEPTAAATTAPPATHRPSATATSDASYQAFGPHPPGSVIAPYRAGQTSWDVSSNGIRLRVSLDRAPKVGTSVTWHVTASTSLGGTCCADYLLFGDGYASSPGMPCDAPDPAIDAPHTYNRAGVHQFMVDARRVVGTNACDDEHGGVLYGSFDVAPGVSTAQGPSEPVVKFDTSSRPKGHEKDFSYVSLWGEVTDDDGWVRSLVVDFGDGTTKTYPGDPDCGQGKDGWPSMSYAMLPYNPAPDYHHYSKPGTYTLTLRTVTTGCDGTAAQHASKSFDWPVPDPSPTATPS